MKTKIALTACLGMLWITHSIADDWLSYGHDPQRTGWSPKETDINRENAGYISLLWKTHLDNQPRELNSLTEAVVSEWIITDKGMKEIAVVAGAADNLFALEASSGKLLWKKTFTVEVKAKEKPHWLCPNSLNATPLIRKDDLGVS